MNDKAKRTNRYKDLEQAYLEEIRQDLNSIRGVDPCSSEYTVAAKNISMINDSLCKHKDARNNTSKIWASSIGSIVGILLVLGGEKLFGIMMTGKAPQFIKKP